MPPKKLSAIIFNSLGIVAALFLYLSFTLIEPLAISAFLILSLIPILGLSNKGFALVLLILNVCLTCGSVVVIGAILFSDLLASYSISMPLALAVVFFYVCAIIINILNLKEIAGVQQSNN